MTALDIHEQAKKELYEEAHRLAVEERKRWLRRPWYARLFPWRIKITIERR
jgi:hypothetical protein